MGELPQGLGQGQGHQIERKKETSYATVSHLVMLLHLTTHRCLPTQTLQVVGQCDIRQCPVNTQVSFHHNFSRLCPLSQIVSGVRTVSASVLCPPFLLRRSISPKPLFHNSEIFLGWTRALKQKSGRETVSIGKLEQLAIHPYGLSMWHWGTNNCWDNQRKITWRGWQI